MDEITDARDFFDCPQCGKPIPRSTIEKRISRGNLETKCKCCLAEPVEYINYGDFTCKPWTGEFDWDLMVPLDEGQPFMPGYRLCGHADCVLRTHIIKLDDMVYQARFDGISLDTLVKRLDEQRMSGENIRMIAERKRVNK